MFFDEYETNNPLGSHRGIQKCGALYVKIPCLPPAYQSKITNIFLFGLFNTLDRDNPLLLKPAIQQLIELETTGIEINIDDESRKIYFKLITITGDNLGIHQMFGFVEGFNSKIFCRFCDVHQNQINEVFHEDNCILRNRDNYANDVRINNSKQTGVVRECIFHEIPDFHVTVNVIVDVMHDLYEVVCRYDIATILNHFILKCHYFSLSQFNTLLSGFHYNFNDRQSEPTAMTQIQLTNKRYIMSLAEMMCLMKNLPVIIGHLIPEDSEHWHLIILLHQIVICETEKYCQFQSDDWLESMISEYLATLQKLFPGHFKINHLLIHHAKVMRMLGPLWHVGSMIFERKHKPGKVAARVSISRRNTCYTIALKGQLTLNYQF